MTTATHIKGLIHNGCRWDVVRIKDSYFALGSAISAFIKENLPNCVIASGISKMPPVEIVL